MKRIGSVLSILLFAVLVSCGSSENSGEIDSKDLTGIWTLYKETKQGKTIDYSGIPSASKFEFKENGYFVFYDQITDDKISNSGVGKIQDYYKGQFEVKGNALHLNHYIQDSMIVKLVNIEKLDKEELVILDKKANKTSYYRH